MNKIITTVIALAAVLSILSSAPAEAHSTPCYVAPLHSGTAAHCRAEGWILQAKLRVDPHRVLSFAVIPKCKAARSTSCWSNFDQAPDGVPTYWVDARGHQRFLWVDDPTRTGGRGDDTQTGRWLTDTEQRTLAAEHGHAPRWWKGCFTDGVTVRCPDGTTA